MFRHDFILLIYVSYDSFRFNDSCEHWLHFFKIVKYFMRREDNRGHGLIDYADLFDGDDEVDHFKEGGFDIGDDAVYLL